MIDLVEVSQEGTHEIIEVPVGDAPEIIEVSTSRVGRAATITIGTVTTGSPGSDANVTNSGTAGEAVLDFTIPTGDTVELRISGGYLQWKNTTAATWTNILEIADITATIGIGTVTTGDPGTDVLVTNSGAGKDAVFNFAIPRGDSVELRIDSGYIQWKTTTATTWNNLHAVSAITPTITVGTVTTGDAGTNVAVTNSGTGKDGIFNFTIPRGDDVQLRIDSGYLQWKNTTASTWTNIVQITDITATITVGTVTTGAAGTSVTFVNAGSGKDAIFNLSIPKGTTFTPSVSAEGVISFTNDGGLTNPSSVNITGPQGPQGAQGPQGNPAPNTIYQYSTDGTTWTTTATGAHWYRQSGDNGVTWSEAIAVSTNDYVDAKITQTITEDVTDKAPSEGAVFDALALKAPLASPALTGTPTAPTAVPQTMTDQMATTKFVNRGIASTPCYYSRSALFAPAKTSIATPVRLWVNIALDGYIKEASETLNLNDEASWDSISPDYRVASARAGKDFYIYACAQLDGTFKYLLSANSTVPTGYTADNSRKIGGFHCLCVSVGTISGHTLSGYVEGDILPASVWDLTHRTASEPEGMVYVSGLNLWVDIYLSSFSDGKLKSAYGGVTADGASATKFHGYLFDEYFGLIKKKSLWQYEFEVASQGSNQLTNIAGSADPNTTGGHVDTASRRMVSNYGLEDCCGALYQWCRDSAEFTPGATWSSPNPYLSGYSYKDIVYGSTIETSQGQTYGIPRRVLVGGG